MLELQIPEEVSNDSDTREILRVWLNGDAQGFASRPDVWSDPAAWGLLFVDLARQVARGYCQRYGGDQAAVLSRIKAGIDAEWASPTGSLPDSVKSAPT